MTKVSQELESIGKPGLRTVLFTVLVSLTMIGTTRALPDERGK